MQTAGAGISDGEGGTQVRSAPGWARRAGPVWDNPMTQVGGTFAGAIAHTATNWFFAEMEVEVGVGVEVEVGVLMIIGAHWVREGE